MKLIGISGSLRQDSFNTRVLHALQKCLPESCDYEILSADLPLYNGDLDGETKPDSVVHFKQTIADADGLIIATPEYNYGFTGVIKNAIDWASRPAFESPLKHKPIALLSASMSPVGGVRAQSALRPVLSGTLSQLYPAPDWSLPMAQKAFDESGNLTDETAQQRLQRFIAGYVNWLESLQPIN